MALEAQEGRLIGRFVSDSVRDIAGRLSLDQAVLEGQARNAVVMFAQLSGFKKVLESSDPTTVIKDLNEHLKTMSRLIRDQGGEIDKFIGDKILAVFHASPDGDLARAGAAALRAAQQMRLARKTSEVPFAGSLGVGIVAGQVLAGILGTPELRLEYTVIGDRVNLASRLADIAAEMPGGAVIASYSLPGKLPKVSPIPSVKVKGKAMEINIFKLNG